ncbi:hypothetical protein BJ165DRAFT_1451166 [Panaeolus papilionaceus]|nr:hypothetical protein BJ165DRAFT_1451166 [Panaeolus papilionaceus]
MNTRPSHFISVLTVLWTGTKGSPSQPSKTTAPFFFRHNQTPFIMDNPTGNRLVPTTLRPEDVANTALTRHLAFLPDPIHDYAYAGEGEVESIQLFLYRLTINLARRSKIMLTIDHGNAFILAVPGNYQQTWLDKLASWMHIVVRKFTLTTEQNKRFDVVEEKKSKGIKEAPELGDNVPSMLFVGSLATHPDHRGRGYGSALLKSVTDIADGLGQKAWLSSSNKDNTKFYNAHGFKTVKEVVVGDDNPTWNKPPIVLSLMVREPIASGSSKR